MPRLLSSKLVRAHTAYRDSTQAIRQRTQGVLRQSWLDLPDYRDGNVEAFATQAARVVRAGQRATATLTAAFTEQAARETTGITRRGVYDLSRLDALREGVDPVEEYLRPGHQLWYELSIGVAFAAAVEHGLTRAMTLSATDLQLAKTDASFQSFQQDDRVLAYERQAGDNPCDLCSLAEGQISKADEVMPIHDNCACDAIPIFDPDVAAAAKSIDEVQAVADAPADARVAFADSRLPSDGAPLPDHVSAQREKNLQITAKWSDRYR